MLNCINLDIERARVRVRIQYGLRHMNDSKVILTPNKPEFVDVASIKDVIDNLSQCESFNEMGFGLVLCELHLTEMLENITFPSAA